MFAVVEDQERPRAGDRFDQQIDRRPVPRFSDAERCAYVRRQELGIAQRGKRHPEGPGRVARCRHRGKVQREPGLAAAPRTRQRDQPGLPEQLEESPEFGRSTDQRGERRRQQGRRPPDDARGQRLHGATDERGCETGPRLVPNSRRAGKPRRLGAAAGPRRRAPRRRRRAGLRLDIVAALSDVISVTASITAT